MEIVQIVGLSICSVVLISVLNEKKEFGIYLGLVTVVVIFFMYFDQLSILKDLVTKINSMISLDEIYIDILFRVVGIAFITELGAGICRDCDQKTIAQNIEFAGKIMILILSAPIILAVVDLIDQII